MFSGDQDTGPCYQLNLDAPTGVDQLAAPAATRLVEHPTGVPFTVSKTAQEVFDARSSDGAPSADNAFAALNGLRVALETNDQAGIQAALGTVRQATAHINGQLGFYGAVENRIDTAIDDAGKLDVRLKTALSDHEDADVAAAALEIQQVQVNRSAALQARGLNQNTSLFDYLR